MKTSNIQTTHSMAIIRGWIDKGLIFRDGTTSTDSILDLTIIGGTIIDNGDGTAVLVIGTGSTDADTLLGKPIQPWSGALSQPPTETELEAILGSPADSGGLTFVVHSTTSGYWYLVGSGGAHYFVLPFQYPAGVGGDIGDGSVVALTSAPEGGWSWFEDPRAIANGAYTYIGYNQAGNLKIAVAVAGVVINTVTLHAAFEYDDHDTPTMYVRPDGKLHVFYSRHIGADIFERISTSTLASDPDLSDGFAAEATLTGTFGTSASTYPSPVYLTNVDGAGDSVFLFWREHVAGLAYWWYAANDFSTGWVGPAHLHSLTYSKIAGDGVGRIDLGISDHPAGGATKIGHLYRESAAWHKSDGTTIGASMPFAIGDVTTVYTATGSELVWISDTALTAGGDPVLAFASYPNGDGTDIRYMYAAWNGASWDVNEIVAAGTFIPDTMVGANPIEQFYHGGLSLDQADPQIVYCSIGNAGVWDMWKYVTADGGATFTPTQLTTTGNKNVRPVGVRNQDDIAAVWGSGTYHSYVNYSLGIRAYIP